MYGFPLQVDIDITEQCNFNCAYCSARARRDIKNELTVDDFISLVDELYELGVCSFNFAGGEPLLKKDIEKLLLHTIRKEGTDVTLVTNGSLLSPAVVALTNSSNFHLLISLDSWIPEINEIYRCNTEVVKKNIGTLKEKGVNFSIAQVLNNRNIDYFETNRALLEENGINNVLLIKYISLNKGRKDDNEIPYEKWKGFVGALTKKKVEGDLKHYSISVACPWEMYLPLHQLGYSSEDVLRIWNYSSPLFFEKYREKYEIGCHAGITSCSIAANGDIYPCSISGQNKELMCGNIKQTPFATVWRDAYVLKRIRSMRIIDIGDACAMCGEVGVCGGGCRIRGFYKGGDIFSPDLSCPIISREGEESKWY